MSYFNCSWVQDGLSALQSAIKALRSEDKGKDPPYTPSYVLSSLDAAWTWDSHAILCWGALPVLDLEYRIAVPNFITHTKQPGVFSVVEVPGGPTRSLSLFSYILDASLIYFYRFLSPTLMFLLALPHIVSLELYVCDFSTA